MAARLLRHDFASDDLRAFARRQHEIREETLAERAGFDGAAGDVYCSDPQAVAGQSAVFLAEAPPLDPSQDDYRGLIARVASGARSSAYRVPSPTLAHMLASDSAGRAPQRYGVAERVESSYESALQVSAAVPNPFMRRALDDAWIATLRVGYGDQSLVLGARAFDVVRDLSARGDLDALARHADVAAWRSEIQTASNQRSRETSAALNIKAEQSVVDHDSGERGAPLASKDLALAPRPLGLMLALDARGSLEDAIRDGGAFRVASPADLAATTPALSCLRAPAAASPPAPA